MTTYFELPVIVGEIQNDLDQLLSELICELNAESFPPKKKGEQLVKRIKAAMGTPTIKIPGRIS